MYHNQRVDPRQTPRTLTPDAATAAAAAGAEFEIVKYAAARSPHKGQKLSVLRLYHSWSKQMSE